ncbi:ABC transporter permease [Alkalihalobacillus alcalophilus ATCC 27647 = CGMCC 1.3604]|uniref:ABC transporter permease n=1 Tax=Alkalihalobacillus alcalophilus ATCC 27647 = CGMCC 1.3604 TaxID=1218173 RepID=J8QEF5_ALKAL|nr:ABC transporter permease [Alkalihalobacillus alcalophilus]AFV25623.1 multidrug/putative exoprotein transporter [Alkalihalobacillus alcalophilus ATCC 27647 = CGMCC 1.3604]KGA98071.1 ABC transporter permease [Alkalihalobacillus alcalophilus ATCC 27647 = CGMCC 1.3604]MED1561043.1 ABC transporter permease [Alkalihalobacillus alcalophilus]THG88334.1 ABC transporter permease [Alkalihalobacillus alcalophilus ATCC 27647 = CGMCC 1.3604]
MKDGMSLWRERVGNYWNEAMRYLRLIANSGFLFTIYILILIGSSYYSQLLERLPENFPTLWIFTIIFALMLTRNKVRTFLKHPDIVFLLPYESQLNRYFKASIIYSFVWHVFYLFVVMVVLAPLFQLRLADEAGSFFYVILLLIIVKAWNMRVSWAEQRLQSESERISHTILRLFINLAFAYLVFTGAELLYLGGLFVLMLVLLFFYYVGLEKKLVLKWEHLIDVDERMVMTFYRIANAFADVPQLRGKVRERKYLRFAVDFLVGRKKTVYTYLFARSFIRANDYLGIYVRLVVIAAMFLYGFQINWLQAVLLLLFMHMVMMQLSTLWFHYDTNMWVDLYPINEDDKKEALTQVSFRLMLLMTFILFLVLLVSSPLQVSLLLLLIGSVFSYMASHHIIHRRKRRKA